MHRQIILSALSKPNVNIFDEVIATIEYEFNKPVNSIQQMKDRDNKKKKGDVWEAFCKDWLLSTGNYLGVWLLDEYNNEFLDQINNVKYSRQDNGIDIIALTNTGWIAIQCKYRNKGKVTWKSLSTFIALCERTGPIINGKMSDPGSWEKYIVMTNSIGVTHKLPKTPKDKSICCKTFRNTSREQWLRLIGKDNGQRLGDIPSEINNITTLQTNCNHIILPLASNIRLIQSAPYPPKTLQLRIIPTSISTQSNDLENLRQRRLAYFEKNNN